jgi:YtxH-like protein
MGIQSIWSWKSLEGRELHEKLGYCNIGALLIGMGIGVRVGLLIAPASGEKTRADISKKVSDFGKKIPNRTRKPQGTTGTYGE